MRIDSIEYAAITVPRIKSFKIATGVSNEITNILVKVTSERHTGLGAAAPNSVTGETEASITASLCDMAGMMSGKNIEEPGNTLSIFDETPFCPAAKAGIDIALHDLFARAEGKRLCDYLGSVKDGQVTDMSLGIGTLEEVLDDARNAVARGFRAIKLKGGLDLEGDIERVARVRDVIGSKIKLRVDANQGYSVDDAIAFCKDVEHLEIEFLEQPVDRLDLVGLGRVRERSPIPIMADESVMSALDVEVVIRRGCADMVNIKLMKCGGIVNAGHIAGLCSDAGLPNMIGCMGETEISVAAAVHFALANKNIRYADLDSHFMLERPVAGGLEFREGLLIPSERPGLGLDGLHLE